MPIVETLSGELHAMPEYQVPRHDIASTCWCGPVFEEGVWTHHSPAKRPQPVAGAFCEEPAVLQRPPSD